MTLKTFLHRVWLASFVLVFVASAAFSQTDSTEVSTESAPAAAEGGIPTDEASISDGESTFKGNCASCHKVNEKLVGPALAGVYDRAPSIDWIVSFVQNSQKVIQSGDDYAVNLYEEYNNTQMTAFPTYDREKILNILAYVKYEAENAAVAEVPTAGGGEGTTVQTSGAPPAYLNAILIGLVVVLVLILVVLVLITTVLQKYLQQKDDLSEEDRDLVGSTFNLKRALTSKPVLFMATFIFAAVAFKVVINQLYAVGVQKGYAPEQPIAFSHKLHAGQYEIDCQYCHTGVRKSKSANIPSPNICMNCHTVIKTESPEIQKIYAAVDENKPIQWVRIHNLPDLAYFNHSQHVQVGEIECQTCHGPIEEMEVVEQYSLLTMGWCIDCHRKTEVNTEGNEYYDNLVELHGESSKEALKVEDIGGLECSKCHY